MLKIIGILVIVIFLIYLATKTIKLHLNVMEGLTMPSLSSTPDSNSDIANFAESYKVATIKMQDTLLLSKYKTNYNK